MADQIDNAGAVPADTTRRSLFRRSAEVAVTAPAIALLLSAAAKSAHAANPYTLPTNPGGLVDTGPGPSTQDVSDLPSGGCTGDDRCEDNGNFYNNSDRPA